MAHIVPCIAVLLLPLWAPPAQAEAGSEAPLARSGPVASLALDQLPGIRGTALASYELEAPVRKDTGEYLGSVQFLGAKARALLHPVHAGIDGTGSGWVLSIEASSARLSDLIPTVADTVVDDLRLRQTAVVLSTGNTRVDGATMSADVAAFYQPYFLSARPMLEVAGGVNLITRMAPGDGSPLGEALRLLGIESDGILLQGTVLKDAGFSDLKKAHKDKELKKRLQESMELRAYLPAIDLGGLPDNYVAGETSLIVGGKPNVGLAFRLVAEGSSAATSQAFECRVDVAKSSPGVTEVQVMGTALGTWEDAFGLAGFDLESPRLLLEVDTAQRIGFGVRAGLGIGSKEMALAAKLQLHAVTGAPIGGFFEGKLDSMGPRDLIELANALGGARGMQPIPASVLPDFELRDLYLKIAPTEGDSDLGTSQGFALRGELHAFDSKVAYVDGNLSLGGIVPTISLLGECNDFDLGAVGLKDASVDINLGATLDQHFRLKGKAKLLLKTTAVDVDCSLKGLAIDVSENFKGVYQANYHLSSPGSGRPNWRVAAALENELTKTLSNQVSKEARDWAEKVKRDFAAAQGGLDRAKEEVRELDDDIERQRAKILARRKKQGASLRSAQRKVSEIQEDLDKVRAKILSKRKARYAKVQKKKRAADSARSAWQKAKKARERAKLHKKPKLRIIEAAKFADYQAKNAAYGTANAHYKSLLKVPIEADPRMVALFAAKESATGILKAAEKMTEVWPIETDPALAALIAARETALAGLNVAKGAVFVSGKTVEGAGRVTAWAAKHNGDLFMLDSASFDAQLAGYLDGGKIDVRVKARFLGDRKSFRVKLDTEVLKDGKLAKALWKHLKSELE